MSNSLKESVLKTLTAIKILSDEYTNMNKENFKERCKKLDIISKLNNFQDFQIYIFRKVFEDFLLKEKKNGCSFETNIKIIDIPMGKSLRFTINKYQWNGEASQATRLFSNDEFKELEEIFETYFNNNCDMLLRKYLDNIKDTMVTFISKLRLVPFKDNFILDFLREIPVKDYNKNIINFMKYIKNQDTIEAYISPFEEICSFYNNHFEHPEKQNKIFKETLLIQDFFNQQIFCFQKNHCKYLKYYPQYRENSIPSQYKIYNLNKDKPMYVSIGNFDGIRINYCTLATSDADNIRFYSDGDIDVATKCSSIMWNNVSNVKSMNVGQFL